MKQLDIEDLLNKLDINEKIQLTSGLDFWHTCPIPRLSVCFIRCRLSTELVYSGIPSIRLSDGPGGVRGIQFFNGVKASAFPCATGLGASFDQDLLQEVGAALGDECRAKGVHILLGPTINIQRNPLGGRGFESFAEDPLLSGKLAAAYVRGVQSQGVQATLVHPPTASLSCCCS